MFLSKPCVVKNIRRFGSSEVPIFEYQLEMENGELTEYMTDSSFKPAK